MTHITGKLAAYLAEELSGAEEARVRDHLAACPACREALAAEQSAWDLLGEAAAAPIPARTASLWPAVRVRTVARDLRETRLNPGWALAAMAAGILIAAALPGSRNEPVAQAGWTATDGETWLQSTWLDESGGNDWAEGWLLAGLDESGDGS